MQTLLHIARVVTSTINCSYNAYCNDHHQLRGFCHTTDWVKVTCRNRDTFVVAGIAFKGKKFDGIYLARHGLGCAGLFAFVPD